MSTLKSRLPQIAAELRPKVSAAVKAAAQLVADEAANRAPDAPPIGKGLVEAMHVEREGAAEYAVVAGGREKDDVFYAHMVEFGTAHSAPQPFLIPALEAKRDEAIRLVDAALKGL